MPTGPRKGQSGAVPNTGPVASTVVGPLARDTDRPPRRARLVTYGLVGLLLLGVVRQVEWWPLSSFRLFSEARTATAASWQVALVDRAGTEYPLDFGRLPRGYRGSHQLAPQLRSLPAGRRNAVCRAWADAAAQRLGVVATEVRVYRVTGQVPTGHGAAPPSTRTLRVTCDGVGP